MRTIQLLWATRIWPLQSASIHRTKRLLAHSLSLTCITTFISSTIVQSIIIYDNFFSIDLSHQHCDLPHPPFLKALVAANLSYTLVCHPGLAYWLEQNRGLNTRKPWHMSLQAMCLCCLLIGGNLSRSRYRLIWFPVVGSPVGSSLDWACSGYIATIHHCNKIHCFP